MSVVGNNVSAAMAEELKIIKELLLENRQELKEIKEGNKEFLKRKTLRIFWGPG